MKITSILIMCLLTVLLYAHKNNNAIDPISNSKLKANTDTMRIKITIGTHIFTATLRKNATAAAFTAQLPISINMNELNGNEKYFDLTNDLPVNASNPGEIQAGDLMLYGSKVLVLFYKTFSTSFDYTRLGSVDNPSGLAKALGSGNVKVGFELQ
jgi:hypothetical protein